MIRLNENQRKRREDRVVTEVHLMSEASRQRIRTAWHAMHTVFEEHDLSREDLVTLGEALAAAARWDVAGRPKRTRLTLSPGWKRQLRRAVESRDGSPQTIS